MPILSVIVAYHSHHGSALAADILLAAFVIDTALGLPIYWSPFFVVGVIGLARPTNGEDGLRWWIAIWIVIWIVIWISVLWKFSWETCFLMKFASSGLPLLVIFG
jgi:hypothetical protein